MATSDKEWHILKAKLAMKQASDKLNQAIVHLELAEMTRAANWVVATHAYLNADIALLEKELLS